MIVWFLLLNLLTCCVVLIEALVLTLPCIAGDLHGHGVLLS